MPEFQQIYPQEHQGIAGDSLSFFKQGDDYMLGQQLIRIEAAGFFLGVDGEDTLGPLG
jgi:hypothetical protein